MLSSEFDCDLGAVDDAKGYGFLSRQNGACSQKPHIQASLYE